MEVQCAASKNKMKITVLKYAEATFGENNLWKGGDKNRFLPISFCFYLIQSEGKNILVDVGCNECEGFVLMPFQSPIEVLKEYGVLPEEVTDVVLTHAHHDHIACITAYSNAIVYIQEDEYKMARKYLSKMQRVRLFKETCKIANDVYVKKIGGHSIGSSIVCAGRYVLCGDECYYKRCLTEGIPTGCSYCPQKSLQFVKKYGNNEKYIPLLFHDGEILKGEVGFRTITEEINE